jgi:hypothetical protein
VVVNDLHIGWTFGGPNKAHPPLFADAHAVLPDAVTRQGFKVVARRRPQKFQRIYFR